MAEFRATSKAAATTSADVSQADQAAEADETASTAIHTKDGEDDAAHDFPGAVGVVHVEATPFHD